MRENGFTPFPSLLNKTNFGFATVIIIFVAVGLFSYRSITLLIETSNNEKETQSSIQSFERLFSSLKDVEAGIRGYILTENEEFLESYYTGNAQVHSEFENLSRILINDISTSDLDTIRHLVLQRISISEKNLEVRRTQGFAK
jgi:CHASE3 domain sensor protein